MTDIVERLRGAIEDDIGTYPAAVKGFNDERDYEQRDGFKSGWNAANLELDKLHQRLHIEAAAEIERLRDLLREARDGLALGLYDQDCGDPKCEECHGYRLRARIDIALGEKP